MDFDIMEGLFCQQTSSMLNGQSSPRLGGRDRTDSLERKKRESMEVNLLDGKRSLNINIFLKQFRSTNEEIIRILRDGCHEDIGAEKLRGLLKILPESDEVEMLRGYDGDQSKLGNAEKFILQLVELPHYRLRIESMLLKDEFSANLLYLEPAIESVNMAAQEIKECKDLHEILYMVLVAGNFLNAGGYAGNAAGFEMMSLVKLADIRANKPGMNLIHYVALEAEKKNSKLLKFPDTMVNLEEAAKVSIESLKSDVSGLSEKVSRICQQVETGGEDIKEQMEEFLKYAKLVVENIEQDISNLENVRISLAEFLCEDLQTFKLEECFKVFHNFCQRFKTAVEENDRRRQQEKLAEVRRKQREEQMNLKRRSSGASEGRSNSITSNDADGHIVDVLLGDIRNGFHRITDVTGSPGRRRRILGENGSDLIRTNSQNSSLPSEEETGVSPRVIRRRISSLGTSNGEENGDSPDTTPNGSLRRRRNRMSSDGDDNLIEYLRQAADQDLQGKDRKSWSSIEDKALVRRSSGRRRRQDFLEMNDRERPASPISPTIDNPELEAKPKLWKRKIEEWFHENEREQEREMKLKEKLASERRKRQEMENVTKLRDSMSNTDVEKVLEAVEEQRQCKIENRPKWKKSISSSSLQDGNETEKKNSEEVICNKASDIILDSQIRPGNELPDSSQPNGDIGHQDFSGISRIRKREVANTDTNNNDPVQMERMMRRCVRYKKFLEFDESVEDVSRDENVSTEIDREGNFDRFSIIRKTTRRSRSRSRNRNSDDEDNVISPVNKDLILSPIHEKNQAGGKVVQTHKADEESQQDASTDNRKKEKVMSLRSRLARRLQSLTENFKNATRISDCTDRSVREEQKREEESDNLYLAEALKRQQEMEEQKRKSLEILKAQENAEKETREAKKFEEKKQDIQIPKKLLETQKKSQDSSTSRDAEEDITEICENSISLESESSERQKLQDSGILSQTDSVPSPLLRHKTSGTAERDEGFDETRSHLSDTQSQGAGSSCSCDIDLADSPKTPPKKKSSQIISKTSQSHSPIVKRKNKQEIPAEQSRLSRIRMENSRRPVKPERSSGLPKPRTGTQTRLPKPGIVTDRLMEPRQSSSKNSSLRSSRTGLSGDAPASRITRPPAGTRNKQVPTPKPIPKPPVRNALPEKTKMATPRVLKPPHRVQVTEVRSRSNERQCSVEKSQRSTSKTPSKEIKLPSRARPPQVVPPKQPRPKPSRIQPPKSNVPSRVKETVPSSSKRNVTPQKTFGFMKATSSSAAKELTPSFQRLKPPAVQRTKFIRVASK